MSLIDCGFVAVFTSVGIAGSAIAANILLDGASELWEFWVALLPSSMSLFAALVIVSRALAS